MEEFQIRNGVLMKYTGTGNKVIVPDSVTSIGDGAFFGSKKLTSIIIPNSVKRIERYAFWIVAT